MDANSLQHFLTYWTPKNVLFSQNWKNVLFQHKGSGASCTVPAQASSLALIFNFFKGNYALNIAADFCANEVEEFSETLGSSNSETESEKNSE